ncbi:MAG TPA: hypothetical protein VKU36_05065 [Candidatus Babeliales bacterium]|jgi:hypothetical protein|nr:hypothetical protein [Candidatus Babeliales bacterium]
MKKLCLLSGMIVCGVIASDVKNPGGLTEKQRGRIEQVQLQKIARQRQLERPDVYRMVDAAIKEEGRISYDGEGNLEEKIEVKTVNWPIIFSVLDSMRGVISVNEYRTYENDYPLLYVAVEQKNATAVKNLLEKYKANPNVLVEVFPSTYGDPMKEMTPLMLAREKGDNAIANLLIKYGAK